MSYLAKIRAKSTLDGTDKTDKTPSNDSFVGFVSTPQGAFREKKSADKAADHLADAIPAAIAGTSTTADELHAELGEDGRADWQTGALGPANLRALAVALHTRKQREAGLVPDGYDDIAECAHCGPVWLFTGGKVHGCPWCFNRAAGLPIPRPASVRCADCQHRQPVEHPHMNRCGAGLRANNPTGNYWTTDRRSCGRWLP